LLEEVLGALGMKKYTLADLRRAFGDPERSGRDYAFECPFCVTRKGSKKLSVSLSRQVVHCFVCGWSGTLASLARRVPGMGDPSEIGAVDALALGETKPKAGRPKTIRASDLRSFLPLLGPADPAKEPAAALAWNYLTKVRGIPEKTVLRARLGYGSGEWLGYVLFPVYEGVRRDQMLYFSGRAYLPDVEPKQRNPPAGRMPLDRGEVIFGADRMAMLGWGVVCEAPLDALKTSPFAGATYGMQTTDAQVDRLAALPLRKLVIYFDREVPAQALAWELAKRLRGVYREGVWIAVPPRKDPGESTPEENAQAVRAAVRVTDESAAWAAVELACGRLPERFSGLPAPGLDIETGHVYYSAAADGDATTPDDGDTEDADDIGTD
jgi:hypothetical protein